MSKFLDKQGVSKLWGRLKDFVNTSISNNVTNKVGQPDGVAGLDSNGKLPTTQLPDLKNINGESIVGSGNITIDLSIYQLVDILPESNQNPNKIYLVLTSGGGGEQDLYTEFIWVNNAWETLGTYKANVDLEPYLKKEEAETTYVKQKANYDLSKNDFTDELKEKLDNTPKFVSVSSQEELDKIDPKDDNTFYYIEGEPIEYLTPEEAEEMFVKADELEDKIKKSGEFVTFDDVVTAEKNGVMSIALFNKLNAIAAEATKDEALTSEELDAILV